MGSFSKRNIQKKHNTLFQFLLIGVIAISTSSNIQDDAYGGYYRANGTYVNGFHGNYRYRPTSKTIVHDRDHSDGRYHPPKRRHPTLQSQSKFESESESAPRPGYQVKTDSSEEIPLKEAEGSGSYHEE